MLRAIIRWLRQAGAFSESDSTRDGFLSYKSETHTVGYGLAVGFLFFSNHQLLQIFALIGVGALEGKRNYFGQRMLREIRDEIQYFLPSIIVGSVLGLYILG